MAVEPKVIVSGAVERHYAARLAELARVADRSVSAEIRRAVREHVERESHVGEGDSARDSEPPAGY
jgi:predicted transcriptional regulator